MAYVYPFGMHYWDFFPPRMLCCGDGCEPNCYVVKVLVGNTADIIDVPFSVIPFPSRPPRAFLPGLGSHQLYTTGSKKANGEWTYISTQFNPAAPYWDANNLSWNHVPEQWPAYTASDGAYVTRTCAAAVHVRNNQGQELYSKLLIWLNGQYCVSHHTWTEDNEGERTYSPEQTVGETFKEFLDCCDRSKRISDVHNMGDGILVEVHPRQLAGGIVGGSIRRVYFQPEADDVTPVADDYVPACGPLEDAPP